MAQRDTNTIIKKNTSFMYITSNYCLHNKSTEDFTHRIAEVSVHIKLFCKIILGENNFSAVQVWQDFCVWAYNVSM